MAAVIVAVLFYFSHQGFGFHIHFDENWFEPLFESGLTVGVVIMSMIVALVIGGLVLMGLLVGGFVTFIAAFFVIGAMLLSSLVFSWPVIIAAVVIWLLVREKPRRHYGRHSR